MNIKRYLHVLLVDQNFQEHFYGMKVLDFKNRISLNHFMLMG